MNEKAKCHNLCRCTCGDTYEIHVFLGNLDVYEPEKHDVDCDHYKAALRAAIAKAEQEPAR